MRAMRFFKWTALPETSLHKQTKVATWRSTSEAALHLNIRYRFTRPSNNPEHRHGPRYIPHLAPTARVSLIETAGMYNTEHEVTFDYESIGGRKYRTTIQLNHRVITSFSFEEIRPQV